MSSSLARMRALEVEVEPAIDLGLDAVLGVEDVVALLAGGGDVARDVRGHQQLGRVVAVLGHGWQPRRTGAAPRYRLRA
jgi:hypothetical protein